MRRFAALLLGGALLALAGCTSGASTPNASTPAPSPSAASTEPSESASPATAGLRGYAVESLACPTTRPVVPATEPVAITGDVRIYRICPPVFGDPPIPRGKAVTVTTEDPATFKALSSALAVPDVPLNVVPNVAPSATPEACAAYANMPVVILVETVDGSWSAFLPRDQCGHYSDQMVSAFTKARG